MSRVWIIKRKHLYLVQLHFAASLSGVLYINRGKHHSQR